MRRPFALIALSLLALPALWSGCSGDGGDGGAGGSTTTASSSSSSSSSSSGGGGGAPELPATYTDPAAVEARLKKSLDDLAAFGTKRCGTEAGFKAGDYVKQRLIDAGFTDVTEESFQFPSFELHSSALAVTLDGAATAMTHDVFAYSGAGQVDADIVNVETGHEANYAGKDVTGKIALVTRDPAFHRQAQYQLAAGHGAVAMLYVSAAPENLIQIGTVSDPEEGLATIPTITVGADDGQKIKDALAGGKTAHAVIAVDAGLVPGTGRNMVARLPGSDPTGAYVVLGAHYDTWYVGATDNGSGTAMLLEAAEALAHGPKREIGTVIVAYDGEELGLFGGYDYLRRHVIKAGEPMLGFINLEMPGAGPAGSGSRAMAYTNGGPMKLAAGQSEAKLLYTLFIPMEGVPAQFGGLIPTDIQGMYWYGLQGVTTYCDTAYYHTPKDTPDKVDTAFLAEAAMAIERMSLSFDTFPRASFHNHDPEVWAPTVATSVSAGGDLLVDVVARDADGAVQAGALVRVLVDVDDFTRSFRIDVKTDSQGKAQITVPKAASTQGAGKRWLHVMVGETYPLSEQVLPLP